jgi:hypothetical protein
MPAIPFLRLLRLADRHDSRALLVENSISATVHAPSWSGSDGSCLKWVVEISEDPGHFPLTLLRPRVTVAPFFNPPSTRIFAYSMTTLCLTRLFVEHHGALSLFLPVSERLTNSETFVCCKFPFEVTFLAS